MVAVLVLAAAGCGDKQREPDRTPAGAPVQGKPGGTLVSLWASDVDHIDPGMTYSSNGMQIVRATQKTLYTPRVDDATVLEPDLAATAAAVSADGCRVTVTLKRGVRFSPPAARDVTSADVKYAIERGFFRSVNNGYAGVYFAALRGAKPGAAPGTAIPGITTPDAHTIVFALDRGPGSSNCSGAVLAGALSMPLTAPVPREIAKRFDARAVSTYGAHQVATGPYMIETDRSGRTVGHDPGRQLRLVRNPSWDARLDTRPAYLDEIEIRQGNDDATLMARRVLEGEGMINGDQPPPPELMRLALAEREEQIRLVPSGGGRWIAMNTTIPPFDDVDVRRAVVAGFDREAMRLTFGGAASGDLPTHFLPPGISGFDEAGGLQGPGLDFMSHPRGDPELAAEYFRRAGYRSGAYEGDETFLMVGEVVGVAANAAVVAQQQFAKLGFGVRLIRLKSEAMSGRFCNVPRAAVAICPTVGWQKDFADPQTFLSPTFSGEHILEAGNANWSQLDDSGLNERMRRATLITDTAERARAWADIDAEITRLAPAIPWLWAKQVNIRSANVAGAIDAATALWSLAHLHIR